MQSLWPKIAHLSFSASGGAGSVARALQSFQSELGYESKFFYSQKGSIYDSPTKDLYLTAAAFLDNYVIKKSSFPHLFSVYRSRVNSKIFNFDESSYDIIHLHWITDFSELSRIFKHSYKNNKKLIWTLHDTWLFTGACHNTGNCTGFLNMCSKCPESRKLFHTSIATAYQNKIQLLFSNPNIKLIFPNKLILETFKHLIPSFIDHYVIPNPVSTSDFYPMDKDLARIELGIPQSDLILGFTATNIEDKNKNIFPTIKFIQQWASKNNKNIHLVLAGRYSSRIYLEHPNITFLGYCNANKLRTFYNAIDYLMNSSLNENLPISILESQACGTPILGFQNNGTMELVMPNLNGLLYQDNFEFEKILEIVSKQHSQSLSSFCKKNVKQSYSEKRISNNYLEVYSA